MVRKDKPRNAQSAPKMVRIGAGIHSLLFAACGAVLVKKLYPSLRPGAVALIFAGACGTFYYALPWIFFTRPKELKKKIPITSQELRWRKKRFYDSLPR
jgi:hypothetical protein